MNQTLLEKITQWSSWSQKYGFDANYGFCRDPFYYPSSYDSKPLFEIAKVVNHYEKIFQIVEEMQPVQMDESREPTYRDWVILKDFYSAVLHVFVTVSSFKEEVKEKIVVPQKIVAPYLKSMEVLGIKKVSATGYQTFYGIKGENPNLEALKNEDIQVLTHNTKDEKNEDIFIVPQIASPILMGQALKLGYEINCIIEEQPQLQEEVTSRLRRIKNIIHQNWNNCLLIIKMRKDYFISEFAVFIGGFPQVSIEGSDEKIYSTGGSGGNDPTINIVEAMFGIKYQGEFSKMHERFSETMTNRHRTLLRDIQNSLIREYCQCSDYLSSFFNEVVEQLAKLADIHSALVKNYRVDFLSEKHKSIYGPELEVVLNKGKLIRKFKI